MPKCDSCLAGSQRQNSAVAANTCVTQGQAQPPTRVLVSNHRVKHGGENSQSPTTLLFAHRLSSGNKGSILGR